ncbi:hypothetical protein R9P31_11250, partial [Escherichia coli]
NQESRLPPGSDFRRWVWITIAPFVTTIDVRWLDEGGAELLLTGIITATMQTVRLSIRTGD